jgi:nicotinamidase-related amidase
MGTRLSATNSVLLVIDVQDKLLAVMPDAKALVRDVGFLLDVANLLQVPVRVTEQYPQGLGSTHADLLPRLPAVRPAKVSFSCFGATGLADDIKQAQRDCIVVAGLETHVCVQQTVLDLFEIGFQVFVPVDAVQARFKLDSDTALRRMEQAGAILTTCEATAFEWLRGSDHPQFKVVSKLVQQRMRQIG